MVTFYRKKFYNDSNINEEVSLIHTMVDFKGLRLSRRCRSLTRRLRNTRPGSSIGSERSPNLNSETSPAKIWAGLATNSISSCLHFVTICNDTRLWASRIELSYWPDLEIGSLREFSSEEDQEELRNMNIEKEEQELHLLQEDLQKQQPDLKV